MTTPSIEYGLLSPILIVFGVAIAGVLVEAFLPKGSRYVAQVLLALGGLVAALVALIKIYPGASAGSGTLAAVGAVTVDRPALFLQGSLLVVAVLSILLIAERTVPAESLTSAAVPASTVPTVPALSA